MRDSYEGAPVAALMQVFWQQINQVALQHKPKPAARPILPAVLTQLEALCRYLQQAQEAM